MSVILACMYMYTYVYWQLFMHQRYFYLKNIWHTRKEISLHSLWLVNLFSVIAVPTRRINGWMLTAHIHTVCTRLSSLCFLPCCRLNFNDFTDVVVFVRLSNFRPQLVLARKRRMWSASSTITKTSSNPHSVSALPPTAVLCFASTGVAYALSLTSTGSPTGGKHAQYESIGVVLFYVH